jgi:hypothetical protein
MLIQVNTLTDEQVAAIEALRIAESAFVLTLDMPSINGADAYVAGQPEWTDDPWHGQSWTVKPDGTVVLNPR